MRDSGTSGDLSDQSRYWNAGPIMCCEFQGHEAPGGRVADGRERPSPGCPPLKNGNPRWTLARRTDAPPQSNQFRDDPTCTGPPKHTMSSIVTPLVLILAHHAAATDPTTQYQRQIATSF